MDPQSTPPTPLLITTPNLDAPDDFYEALIEAHQSLSNEESYALNARLVLVLSNHIGSLPVLREAFAAARRAGPGNEVPTPPTRPAATATSAPAPAPTPTPTPAPAPAPRSPDVPLRKRPF